ncbi:MAG: redoxin domain-containing protein [Candidatus Eisenbacteria bacterium]|nr:redoxin domain-containing protein [Candidatus Eisenbacteria bacterium]
MPTSLKPGDKAPAFSGRASDGSTISLGDFTGEKNLVLYFYPMDNSPGCTREARAFRDAAGALAARETAIVGVSTQSVESHKRFIANNELPFPLISDSDKEVAKSYGVLKENGKTAERATFLIDKKGRIRNVWPRVSITGHTDEVLSAIESM